MNEISEQVRSKETKRKWRNAKEKENTCKVTTRLSSDHKTDKSKLITIDEISFLLSNAWCFGESQTTVS